MTNPDDPAFPFSFNRSDPNQDFTEGLTKREYCAIKAMQALLSSIETQRHMQEDGRYTGDNFKEIVAMNAIEFADELLKQLEEQK